MHNRSSQNTRHKWVPAGSEIERSTQNLKNIIIGPNTNVVAFAHGSYATLDIRHKAHMDGSDSVNHDIREFHS
jgi:hypothetical protein